MIGRPLGFLIIAGSLVTGVAACSSSPSGHATADGGSNLRSSAPKSVVLGAGSSATDLSNATWFGDSSAVHDHCNRATNPTSVFGKATTVTNGGVPIPPFVSQVTGSGRFHECRIEVAHSDTMDVSVSLQSPFPVRQTSSGGEPVDLSDVNALAASLFSQGFSEDTATAGAAGAKYAFVHYTGPDADIWFVGGDNTVEVKASSVPLTRSEVADLCRDLLTAT